MRVRFAVVVSTLVIGVASFGSAATAARGNSTAPIVGRWQQSHTCDELVSALNALGLGTLAPGVVGDYFPNQTPQQLAKKKNLCQGAKPQIHWHFFTADGKFGSVDQHGEQVDGGTYAVSGSTLKIGEGSFRFRIQGKTLMLKPLLTSALKQEALADPLNFHTAGWMIAVAIPGHPWNRVACRTWC
jgi:hypothetical protein